jgi:hypothetical protein
MRQHDCSQRERRVVNRTTTDADTPIFSELNAELGELPEIVVPAFDWQGVEFGGHTSDDRPAEPEATPSRRGGRRRRKD